MGGVFGLTSKRDAVSDVFFGTDYHSHLGTRRAGMTAWDKEEGFQRDIHNISNSPFRKKFDNVLTEMKGTSCIGAISDTDPQPQLVRSILGTYAVATVGRINNVEEIIKEHFEPVGYHFDSLSGGQVTPTELVSALIALKGDFVEGIRFAHKVIDGTALVMILKSDGSLIVARDKCGRLPLSVGRDEDGYCAAFETYSYTKLGYEKVRDLKAGEIVELTPDGATTLFEGSGCKKTCAFLWAYFGYPASSYDGINVEAMRIRNGEIMAENDKKAGVAGDVDSVSGVPDSGTPHAIGYANTSKLPFTRPFIKYTPTWPRSFMPSGSAQRVKIAKMKQIPVHDFIENKKLLLVDDSIVRGTQLQETVEFLYDNGAVDVHMRSACPPIMYGCKYLNFSRNKSDYDLIARRIILELEGEEGEKYIDEYASPYTERGKALRQKISEKFGFASLEYQTLEGIIKAIGLDESELCTYCWTGKE